MLSHINNHTGKKRALQASRNIIWKTANLISIICHPLLTIPLFVLIASSAFGDFKSAALVSFLIIGCIFLPSTIMIFIRTRRGSYTNFDISDMKQRNSLFIFALPLIIAISIILYETGQPRIFYLSVFFAFLLMFISQIVNFYIKSSLHVSLNIFLSSLVGMMNIRFGVFVFLLTGLIGWSRLTLGRHTLKEIITGAGIGVSISLVMLCVEGFIK